MALSKTNRDGTRQIGGARAWWVVEQFRAASSVQWSLSFFKLDISLRRPCSKSSWLERSCSSREYHSPKEALHRFVTRLDRPCAACTWRSSPASTCNMARGEFDRSSWSSTSMINWQIAWRCFSASEVQNDDKRKACSTPMVSNFRHLTGCEDGTGTFCCYGKSRRQRQIAHWPPRSARSRTQAMRTDWSTIECEETFEFCMSVCWCFLLFQNKSQAKGCL